MPIDPSIIKRLIYIDVDGIQALTRQGDISNLGGTSSPTFTVDGKALLFSDGTSTDGSIGSSFSLQSIYDSSLDLNGDASIKLTTGKDFIVRDDTDDNVFFKIDSTTGKITITGDLEVFGTASIIETQTQTADHWHIAPNSSNTIALSIEPEQGVVINTDLVNIKTSYGTSPAFRIDSLGKTYTKNLQVSGNIVTSGTINGVDIVELNNEVSDHISSPSFPKHLASQILVSPTIALAPTANNVQQALEQISQQIDFITSGNTIGIEHIQSVQATVWTIAHNRNTKRIQWSLYNDLDEWVLPDSFKLLDMNTVQFSFGSAMAGRAVLITF